ncbi:hypothetical protein [Rhabdothermincola salaria]|uniref:hypothetical protein n=1 Tax=Rhabdothermincola salaria TaxID=2903142 RepID=UPI001E2B136C|nr:hypothetical protein [Rhabdothermincola salaria]MCD9625269.1 hypothetical protein [Rhabdothermincola salaria]
MAVARRAVTAALLAGGLVVAACGGGDGGGESADGAGLQAAGEKVAAAVVAQDFGVLYGRLTEECRDSLSRADFNAEMTVAFAMAEGFGIDLSEAEVGEVLTREVTETTGEVAIEFLFDGEPFDDGGGFEPYVYEDGSWRTVDCEFSGDSPSSEDREISDGDLRSNSEVAAEAAVEDAVAGRFGEEIDLSAGLIVTVSDPVAETSSRVSPRIRCPPKRGNSTPSLQRSAGGSPHVESVGERVSLRIEAPPGE